LRFGRAGLLSAHFSMSDFVCSINPSAGTPRRMRRTVWILVGLIVISGVGILFAYLQMARRQGAEFHPPISTRLQQNLGVVRQDGSGAGLLDLAGDVWVLAAVTVREPERWAKTRDVLKRLQTRYAGRKDFHLVCLTVDPNAETPEVLAGTAKDLGAELPNWWFAAAGEDFVHKYLKDKFKMSMLPHRDGGHWVYDTSVMVVDRDRHVRLGQLGQTSFPFDFEQAAEWDAKGMKTGTAKSNQQTMEDVLVQTIDFLLAQPASAQ